MNDPLLIELDHVTLVRSGVEILSDASWRLEAGRHWAVLGPNGSGKSTLLRVAAGYLRPNRGRIRWQGEELVDLRGLRRTTAWVAGDMAADVPAQDTALETVVTGRMGMIGMRRLSELAPTENDFDDARNLLEKMHCGELARKPFGVLSQGERQQVLVARARFVDPQLIVLDEPCAGMDPGVRERFLAWLDDLAATDDSPTMVLATHHVEEIMPRFESTLLMKSGRVAAAGPTDDVVTAETLASIYDVVVDRLEVVHGRRWVVWHPSAR